MNRNRALEALEDGPLTLGGVEVATVLWQTKSVVIFKDPAGKIWRWVNEYKDKAWPFAERARPKYMRRGASKT
jgi:hypothetical protein